MKKHTICLVLTFGLFLISFGLKAQTEENNFVTETDSLKDSTFIRDADTIEINTGKRKILIIKTGNSKDSTVIFTKEEGDSTVRVKKSKVKNDHVWKGIFLGINGYLGPNMNVIPDAPYDFMELNATKSIGVQINFYEERINLFKDRINIITGMGFEWNNFRFTQNITFSRASDYPDLNPGIPVFGFQDTGRNYLKSKLALSSLNIPVLLNFSSYKANDKGKQFNLSLGVIGSLRYGSRSKVVFKEDKKRSGYTDKGDYGINPFALQAAVRVRYGRINLFSNYALTSMFIKGKGPELYPFNLGLGIGF